MKNLWDKNYYTKRYAPQLIGTSMIKIKKGLFLTIILILNIY